MVNLGYWIRARLEQIGYSKNYNTGGFRIGQYYNPTLVESVSRRDDVAYFWTTDIVYRAMSDGFIITDSKDEEPDWMEEFLSLNWIDNIIRGVVFERKGGSMAFSLHENLDKTAYELLPFHRDDVEFKINEVGQFAEFKLREWIDTQHEPLYHIATGEMLENIFHEALRPARYKYQGSDVLEPIWDLLNTRQIILQSVAIITGRLGPGLRKATLAVRTTGDDKAVTDMEMGLKRLEADDTTVLLRSGHDNQNRAWKDELEIDTGGSAFNYIDKIEIVVQGLSIATGVPANYFKGIFFGSLYASDSILRQLHTSLTRIQFDWGKRIEKMIERWCELTGKAWNPEWKIVWNLKPELTEQERALTDKVIADTYVAYKNAGLMTSEEIREELGYDPTITIEQPKSIFSVEGLNNDEEEEEEEVDGTDENPDDSV